MQNLFLLVISLLFTLPSAWAERRDGLLDNVSSSGRTFSLDIPEGVRNLQTSDPILLRKDDEKIGTAKVIQVEENRVVGQLLEAPTEELEVGGSYNILFGGGFTYDDDALPEIGANRGDDDLEEIPDNPESEKFLEDDEMEVARKRSPDLDDQDYTPEILTSQKLDKRVDSTHHLTVGFGFFRGADVEQINNPNARTYRSGYVARYAYNFPATYWLHSKTTSILSAEAGIGSYSFAFRASNGQDTQVNVRPLSFNMKLMVPLSRLFRIYPYLGVSTNLVAAQGGVPGDLHQLKTTNLMLGGGAALVMSTAVDFRVDVGTDGGIAGVIAKF